MPPKKGGGATKKKTVNMDKNAQNPGQKLTDPGQKKIPLASKSSQSKSPIAPLILEGVKLNKIQVSDLIKKHLKDIRVHDIQLSRTGMFTLYASDVNSFNRLLNEFTAILATNGRTSANLFVPRSIQRIKDTDKIAFIKRVDLEIPEDRITVALKDVGLDVTDVIRLKNKERNTPTQTIKVTFTDAHNRNTFVHTGLQVDSMHFVAEAAKHNSKPSKQQTCARCGENHQVDKCNAAADTWKCCNCKGSHLATSNECPFYKEQEKRMLKAVQQYSTSSTPSTAVPYNVNNLVDFPYFPSSTQQGLTNPSNDLIDTLVNILSMKMEKIIEATANRLMKSLHQRISKIEKTIAAVDSMMDVASNETSDDSLTDSDNDIQVVNVQQDKQQQQTSQNSTTSSSTQQQPITTNDITKPPNKKKATSKTVKRNRSPNSSLDATTSNNKDM
ncbi:unnamed protein product [Rotaria magnacalcarata]|uniref:Gag-like protein n=1 Tax=Rotaria magnacalcarata TaxID=392030 RepID=A0A816PFB2_9BILA|nr:unnamed protein product [Rotaria magnacalcarata]